MKILSPLALFVITSFVAATSKPDQNVLGPAKIRSDRPNIVFILTDDQDLHMNSLSYLPFVQKHLINKGTFYRRHFCTIALCCPSRVSLWTGKAAHNTNVTDVNPPYGMSSSSLTSPGQQLIGIRRKADIQSLSLKA
jgi:hypothetical protein